MKIIGAKVFEKEGRFSERDLFASGQRICRESETDGEEAIDARGPVCGTHACGYSFSWLQRRGFLRRNRRVHTKDRGLSAEKRDRRYLSGTMTYPEERLGRLRRRRPLM